MIQSAQSNCLRFGWVGLDGLYGNCPELLRNIADAGLLFTADVHCDQHIYSKDPAPYLPERSSKFGRMPSRLQGRSKSERIDSFFSGADAPEFKQVFVRKSTK